MHFIFLLKCQVHAWLLKFPVPYVPNVSVSLPKVIKVLCSARRHVLDVENAYCYLEEEVSQMAVRADVSCSFLACIKDVREKPETLGSAGNRLLKGESLEHFFSALTAYKTFMLITKTVSRSFYVIQWLQSSIFYRTMMLSLNLIMTISDLLSAPFHKFAFYSISVPRTEPDDILPSYLTVMVVLICKVHLVMEIWKLSHLRF